MKSYFQIVVLCSLSIAALPSFCAAADDDMEVEEFVADTSGFDFSAWNDLYTSDSNGEKSFYMFMNIKEAPKPKRRTVATKQPSSVVTIDITHSNEDEIMLEETVDNKPGVDVKNTQDDENNYKLDSRNVLLKAFLLCVIDDVDHNVVQNDARTFEVFSTKLLTTCINKKKNSKKASTWDNIRASLKKEFHIGKVKKDAVTLTAKNEDEINSFIQQLKEPSSLDRSDDAADTKKTKTKKRRRTDDVSKEKKLSKKQKVS